MAEDRPAPWLLNFLQQVFPGPHREQSPTEQSVTDPSGPHANPYMRAYLGSARPDSPAFRPQTPLQQEIETTAGRINSATQELPVSPVTRAVRDNPITAAARVPRARAQERDQYLAENPLAATEAEQRPFGQPRRAMPHERVVQYNLGNRVPEPANAGVPREGLALLDVISQFEGTNRYGNRGYNTLVGGSQVDDLTSHPRRVGVTTADGPSTAFGRYQFIGSTWDRAAAELGLRDMSPEAQDRAAWWLAQRAYRGATGRDLSTDITDESRWEAIGQALGTEWASFPGRLGRNQRQHTVDQFRNALQSAFGTAVRTQPRNAGEYIGLDPGFRRAPRARSFEGMFGRGRRALPVERRRNPNSP
jgi:muramidase (phage lysozyme)